MNAMSPEQSQYMHRASDKSNRGGGRIGIGSRLTVVPGVTIPNEQGQVDLDRNRT